MSDRFTKAKAREAQDDLNEIFNALPKSKMLDFIGHFNDINLFLTAAANNAPDEKQED